MALMIGRLWCQQRTQLESSSAGCHSSHWMGPEIWKQFQLAGLTVHVCTCTDDMQGGRRLVRLLVVLHRL